MLLREKKVPLRRPGLANAGLVAPATVRVLQETDVTTRAERRSPGTSG